MRARWRRWRWRAAYAASALTVTAIVTLLAIGWVGAERATHPTDTQTLADFPQLRTEAVAFARATGRGWPARSCPPRVA